LRTFREAVQSSDLSITVELALNRQSTAADVDRQIDSFCGKVDGIQVSDNPWAWVQMSALAAASLILKKGIDPVPILTCRDRNRIALQSDLLGLRAMGVSSVLLTRGHRVPTNHVLPASTVFDTTGRELIAMADELNEDESVGPGEKFFIGTGARAFRPGEHWRAESLTARANAGAQFLQTQLCFNTAIIRKYMDALVRAKLTWKYSVVVSLTALPSADTAVWLKNNLLDSRIPAPVIKRLKGAVDPEHEGIKICAELIQEISEIPGVSGVNLMSMGSPEALSEAIVLSGLKS
jgi:5,10-methylenetetrahydrofolate reductase